MTSFRTRYAVKCALVAFVFLFVAGCNRAHEQQRLALDGIQKLREQFNTGACQAISDEFADRVNQSRQEWLEGCERMRESLGSWKSFGSASAAASSRFQEPPTVFVEGRAAFENGDNRETYWLESYWHIKNHHAQVYFLYLEGGGKQIALPHLPKDPKKIRDPDVVRGS
jgi:hypothetical protein